MKLSKSKLNVEMAKQCIASIDLLKASGLIQSTYSRAIRGEVIRPITAGKIARALNVDVMDILETEEGNNV